MYSQFLTGSHNPSTPHREPVLRLNPIKTCDAAKNTIAKRVARRRLLPSAVLILRRACRRLPKFAYTLREMNVDRRHHRRSPDYKTPAPMPFLAIPDVGYRAVLSQVNVQSRPSVSAIRTLSRLVRACQACGPALTLLLVQ